LEKIYDSNSTKTLKPEYCYEFFKDFLKVNYVRLVENSIVKNVEKFSDSNAKTFA